MDRLVTCKLLRVHGEMLCKLKLLCNMETLITNLATATDHEVHLKSPMASCHPILVGAGGVFVVVLTLPAWISASVLWPSGA